MTIRPATAGDRDALLHMALRFLASSRYGTLVGSTPEHLERLITFLQEDPRGVAFLAECDGQAAGLIAATVVPNHISGRLSGSEIAWWVQPEFRRRTRAGVRLLDAAEAWARAQRAETFQMIAPAGAEDLEGFYRRRGYVELETVFQLRLAAA